MSLLKSGTARVPGSVVLTGRLFGRKAGTSAKWLTGLELDLIASFSFSTVPYFVRKLSEKKKTTQIVSNLLQLFMMMMWFDLHHSPSLHPSFTVYPMLKSDQILEEIQFRLQVHGYGSCDSSKTRYNVFMRTNCQSGSGWGFTRQLRHAAEPLL